MITLHADTVARVMAPNYISANAANRAADQFFGAAIMADPASDDQALMYWLSEAYVHLGYLPGDKLGYCTRALP